MTGTVADSLIRHLRRMAAPPATRELSDGQLLQRFAAGGTEAAFAALLHRHGRLVWSVCRRLLGQEQDAEDVFQAVFLTLARRAGAIRKEESVASWLYGVAYHLALKARRKIANRHKYEARVRPRREGHPTAEMMCRELQALLDAELCRLPEKYRAPFVLCCLEGKGHKEAAAELGWKEGTLSGRLAMAKRLVRQRLARRGVSLGVVLATVALADTSASAAVPASLWQSTLQAAHHYAAGTGPAVSPPVAELLRGGSQTMLPGKVKIVTVLLFLAGAAGLGLAAPRATQAPAPPQQPPTRPAQVKASPAAAPKEAGEKVEVKGRVLGPDGQPLAGAKVSVWTNAVQQKTDMRVRATTGADGRFRFSISESDARRQARIVATAPDLGPDWIELSAHPKGDEITLRPVWDDVPINGRILDLEGRPVAHVTVRVLKLHQTNLDWWLKEAKLGRWYYPNSIAPEALDTPVEATTGADGRFQLRGLGRDRLVYLMISGETIQRVRCWVLMRAGDAPQRRGESIYSATFDHIAGACKPIIGTVREKGTGKLLPGISVMTDHWINNAKTDEHGRYRIVGQSKQSEYTLAAAGVPYFARTKQHIADTPGFEPLVVDFELERGIAFRGRVVNKVTGEPIQAHVTYHSLSGNPNLQSVSGLDDGIIADDRNNTKADGSFFVVGLPGPGLLTVLADEDDYLKPERPADWQKLVPYVNLAPPLVHAWVRVDLAEKDPSSTRRDIALEPARAIAGRVLGPDGRPLSGYFVAGLTGSPVMHAYQMLRREEPAFRVRGLDPGRPRSVVFSHPEKKLGKVLVVRAEETGPLEVRLEPCSSATGRILDARGRPWPGLRIRARLSPREEDNRDLPIGLHFDPEWQQRLAARATTDADGKFRLDGLMPGLKYALEVSEHEVRSRADLLFPLEDSWPSAESGKTRDLGELKSK
jgi:RNA polymerase sigma factor (sigma-70 family)